MKKWLYLAALAAVVALGGGCAGKTVTNFTPPQEHAVIESRVFDQPYDKVWEAAVHSIGASYFVLENIEKDSGILSLSFSPQNPGELIDCGVVHDSGTAAMQTIDRTFQGTDSNVTRRIVEKGVIYDMLRTCSLSGKSNILVQKIGQKQTSVTVRTRYIFTLNNLVQALGQPFPTKLDHTMTFTGSELGRFANTAPALECRSRGVLEKSILDGIAQRL